MTTNADIMRMELDKMEEIYLNQSISDKSLRIIDKLIAMGKTKLENTKLKFLYAI